MSDPKDAQGSGADPNPEPPSSGVAAARPEEAERPEGESWFDRLLTAVGLKSQSLRDELEEALEGDAGEGGFSKEERDLLNNVLNLHEMRVADIMVPRADMYAVDLDATLAELLSEFRESGHSRMPVYRETLDDGVGVIHVKDLVDYIANAAMAPARGKKTPGFDFSRVDLSRTVAESDLVREVLFVPPSMPVANLLALMKGQRRQMALVIDEFGGTDGLVSIEDAVEAIVGDIEDEHDEEEPPEIVAEKGGSFVMDAGASLEDVAKAIGGDFAKDRDDEEIETIGGMVFSLLGRIPVSGEKLMVPGFEIQIIDADQRRIHRLRIRPVAPSPAEPEPVTDLPRAASRA